MHVNTETQADAASIQIAQYIKSIYDTQFGEAFPSEIDFFEQCVWFVTLTLNPAKVSLNDSLGLGNSRCFYQDLIDEQKDEFQAQSTKPISYLLKLASDLQIKDAHKLCKLDLIFEILSAQGIKPVVLQRPLTVFHSKPHPIKVAEQLHFAIARACVGGNLSRKIPYQPLMFAYTDFEATRRGAAVDPLQSSWPHVHAILFVRPEHTDRFFQFRNGLLRHFEYLERRRELDKLVQLDGQLGLGADEQAHRLMLQKLVRTPVKSPFKGDLPALHDIKIDAFNYDNPLAELVGYCKKGLDRQMVQHVLKDNRWRDGEWSGAKDLWHVFPRQLDPKTVAAPVEQPQCEAIV